MQTLVQVLLSSVDVAALAMLIVFIPTFLLFTLRARSGRRFALRPISIYARFREMISQATESGRPVQLCMGTGQIGTGATAEVVAGLTMFEFAARQAALGDASLQGVTGDATVLAAARGALQRESRLAGAGERDLGREVHFCGPTGMPYAAGSLDTLRVYGPLGNTLIGPHDAEGLWIAEACSRSSMQQVGGTADPAAAALMRLALGEVLVGEEVFAAGAYLHRPSHLGSLAAQDLMRLVIMIAIGFGIVIASLGLAPSLSALL
ncbi:MAG: hypothetical protein FJZ90_02765 [Chloroflexi bacterium]|nr:hypothetical protein [Chloroflexota bacterium]